VPLTKNLDEFPELSVILLKDLNFLFDTGASLATIANDNLNRGFQDGLG